MISVAIIPADMRAGAYIPFQALGPVDVTMYFIKTGEPETVIPEIEQAFQGPVTRQRNV